MRQWCAERAAQAQRNTGGGNVMVPTHHWRGGLSVLHHARLESLFHLVKICGVVAAFWESTPPPRLPPTPNS